MVTRPTVDTVLRDFLEDTFGATGVPPYDDSTRFIEELELQSLDFVALLSDVEERLGVHIADEDLTVSRFATVGALREYVKSAEIGAS